MDHYIDIKLLPDPEFGLPVLMSALYGKLHRALVTAKATNIGVSFPGYQRKPKTLGNSLRLHGSQAALVALQEMNWLKGMSDHIIASDVLPAPISAKHLLVRRRQYKTSAERLRRRRMKRKGETYEQAEQAIPVSIEREPDLPYLTLRSLSTKQTFCLFVEQGLAQNAATAEFNYYGLSEQATVPYF